MNWPANPRNCRWGTERCHIDPNMGIIIPKLGMKPAAPKLSLADALLPKSRQRLLAVLLMRPDQAFYTNELIQLTKSGNGAIQRELADLTQVGVLTCKKIGNQKHYQANQASPIYAELRGLILKTVGLADVLRDALAPLADQIVLAFVFGSVAKGEEFAGSDIDLLVVSDTLGYGELMLKLEVARNQLGREIQPQLYHSQEFKMRQSGANAFVQRVMTQPKVWLFGIEGANESHAES
jgi:predicted nucleotidyltransferase